MDGACTGPRPLVAAGDRGPRHRRRRGAAARATTHGVALGRAARPRDLPRPRGHGDDGRWLARAACARPCGRPLATGEGLPRRDARDGRRLPQRLHRRAAHVRLHVPRSAAVGGAARLQRRRHGALQPLGRRDGARARRRHRRGDPRAGERALRDAPASLRRRRGDRARPRRRPARPATPAGGAATGAARTGAPRAHRRDLPRSPHPARQRARDGRGAQRPGRRGSRRGRTLLLRDPARGRAAQPHDRRPLRAGAARRRRLSPDPPNPRPDSAAGTRKQVPL